MGKRILYYGKDSNMKATCGTNNWPVVHCYGRRSKEWSEIGIMVRGIIKKHIKPIRHHVQGG